jgi:hypothetical protein
VTFAKRPSEWDGTAADIEVIWGGGEADSFSRGDWTGRKSAGDLICPAGNLPLHIIFAVPDPAANIGDELSSLGQLPLPRSIVNHSLQKRDLCASSADRRDLGSSHLCPFRTKALSGKTHTSGRLQRFCFSYTLSGRDVRFSVITIEAT